MRALVAAVAVMIVVISVALKAEPDEKCQYCQGTGYYEEYDISYEQNQTPKEVACFFCNGAGKPKKVDNKKASEDRHVASKQSPVAQGEKVIEADVIKAKTIKLVSEDGNHSMVLTSMKRGVGLWIENRSRERPITLALYSTWDQDGFAIYGPRHKDPGHLPGGADLALSVSRAGAHMQLRSGNTGRAADPVMILGYEHFKKLDTK